MQLPLLRFTALIWCYWNLSEVSSSLSSLHTAYLVEHQWETVVTNFYSCLLEKEHVCPLQNCSIIPEKETLSISQKMASHDLLSDVCNIREPFFCLFPWQRHDMPGASERGREANAVFFTAPKCLLSSTPAILSLANTTQTSYKAAKIRKLFLQLNYPPSQIVSILIHGVPNPAGMKESIHCEENQILHWLHRFTTDIFIANAPEKWLFFNFFNF